MEINMTFSEKGVWFAVTVILWMVRLAGLSPRRPEGRVSWISNWVGANFQLHSCSNVGEAIGEQNREINLTLLEETRLD